MSGDALNMNYAYGVEFVEVDPMTMGLDQQVVVHEVEEAYAEPDDDRRICWRASSKS